MVVHLPADTSWASPWHDISHGWNNKVEMASDYVGLKPWSVTCIEFIFSSRVRAISMLKGHGTFCCSHEHSFHFKASRRNASETHGQLHCFDEQKIWRQAGFEEMLVSFSKRDQNGMGGLQKRERF